MKVAELLPCPIAKEAFRRANMLFVTKNSGCYVLATFDRDILYVGLANDLRRRFGQHLDTPEKVAATRNGRAIWFFWLECTELEKVARTWINSYVLQHGTLPILNKVNSPVST